MTTLSGADPPGGQGGHGPIGGREVPQLIEGSETYQPEVKASKSDKRLRSYGQLKKTKHFLCFLKLMIASRPPPPIGKILYPPQGQSNLIMRGGFFSLKMPQQGLSVGGGGLFLGGVNFAWRLT